MAVVELDEMKNYLRVDSDEDDSLIEDLIDNAQKSCMDIARLDDEDEFAEIENAKVAVMFTTAYLYEHREEADHHALMLTLRALLFGSREAEF